MKSALRSGASELVNDTVEVTESITQHKYSLLANASYTFYDSKGDVNAVHESLKNPELSYVQDLGGFEVDREMSTIDNLVLNNKVTGETVISYRGTTTEVSKQFFKDWKINAEIAGGSTTHTRLKEAQSQFDRVVSKYGKDNLTLTSHSQGSNVGHVIGVKNDVPSFNYNPAVNHTQIIEAEKYASNVSKQTIYKTPLDFASPLAYHKQLVKSNTELNIVHNLEGMDSVIDTHSIDQFHPKPSEIVGDIVKVERRTLSGSIAKSAGHIVGAATTVYQVAQDVKRDKNVSEVAVDLAKTGEEYVVDGELLAAGIALAPETLGLSVVASLGAVIVNDLVTEHTASFVKDELPKLSESLKRTGNKVGRWFHNLF